MNTLIDDNKEASSTIERWEREEIKYSETERYHRHQGNNTIELNTMVSESDENSSDSDWTTDTVSCFFFLFFCCCIRKARRQYSAESTEGKPYLLVDFCNTVSERGNEWIMIVYRCHVRQNICPHFTIHGAESNVDFLVTSLYLKYMTHQR